MASPSRLKESTTKMSESDGIKKYVGSLITYLIESEMSSPHVADGGCTPIPRYEKTASAARKPGRASDV
jgi:hypothetical protein